MAGPDDTAGLDGPARPGETAEFRTVTEIIPDALDGERVDRIVSFVADVSRKRAVELLAVGSVSVDGRKPEKPSERVETGSELIVHVPTEPPRLTPDASVEIVVHHVDEHVIVVDKQAQLVVHPGSGVTGNTLVNGLLARFPELESVGEADRPGIVHRLDRGTSGLLMVARTPTAYLSLVGQLSARTVARRYSVLAAGLVAADQGLIDAPLGRSPRDATKRAVVGDGRPARTRYEVTERFEHAELTYLRCRLETGRTHQIRAHLAAIDHPVVGDERYGGPRVEGLDRPFLHAEHLGFEHPVDGTHLSFDSELPSDLRDVLKRLTAENQAGRTTT